MNVLVVDDEAPARSRLCQLVSEIDGVSCVGTATNGSEALSACVESQPEIVLLDIRMPGIDGIETARHLAGLDQPPAVIFTTAFDQYAVQAFETHAVGYLLKPVRRRKLEEALAGASRLTSAQLRALHPDQDGSRQHISARIGDEIRLVPVASIRCFRSDQKYVTVTHTDGEELIDESLRSLEEEFRDQFVRVHRNTLAAVNHIRAMRRDDDGRYIIELADVEDPVPVSRRHVTDVKARLRSA